MKIKEKEAGNGPFLKYGKIYGWFTNLCLTQSRIGSLW